MKVPCRDPPTKVSAEAPKRRLHAEVLQRRSLAEVRRMYHVKALQRRLCDGGSNMREGRELGDERGTHLGFLTIK